MNPLLGLAFGLLLVKALLPSDTPAPAREDEDPEARRARIARRKARRDKARRESEGNKPNPDPGNNPAT